MAELDTSLGTLCPDCHGLVEGQLQLSRRMLHTLQEQVETDRAEFEQLLARNSELQRELAHARSSAHDGHTRSEALRLKLAELEAEREVDRSISASKRSADVEDLLTTNRRLESQLSSSREQLQAAQARAVELAASCQALEGRMMKDASANLESRQLAEHRLETASRQAAAAERRGAELTGDLEHARSKTEEQTQRCRRLENDLAKALEAVRLEELKSKQLSTRLLEHSQAESRNVQLSRMRTEDLEKDKQRLQDEADQLRAKLVDHDSLAYQLESHYEAFAVISRDLDKIRPLLVSDNAGSPLASKRSASARSVQSIRLDTSEFCLRVESMQRALHDEIASIRAGRSEEQASLHCANEQLHAANRKIELLSREAEEHKARLESSSGKADRLQKVLDQLKSESIQAKNALQVVCTHTHKTAPSGSTRNFPLS